LNIVIIVHGSGLRPVFYEYYNAAKIGFLLKGKT
jgi:hypothetical protein